MQKSIFRYPGAKTKLLPVIMHNFKNLIYNGGEFIDAFVGGGSVLLEVANQYPKIGLYANDKDYWIYSFWKIVSGNNEIKFEQLLNMMSQQPTLELFYSLRAEDTLDDVRCAYKAIFFNRTAFSGILHSGPIGGKDQKSKYSIDCRYNIKTLREKIINCRRLLKGRLIISNENFDDYIPLTESNALVYLDPPYYKAGDSLYFEKMNEQDHFTLSVILFNRDNWVLSYDDCQEIRSLYEDHNILNINAQYCITGVKNSWKQKNELIILP